MPDDDEIGDPPCMAHLIVGSHAVDPATARDVARFRKAERDRLVGLRRTLPQDERRRLTDALIDALTGELADVKGRRIAVYWPIRGEPDLRPLMTRLHERGATVLLPVVVARGMPLEFRPWSPRCAMTRGAWNIPQPESGEAQHPDVVISPLVGVDPECFRLGNGGGYYDRTLAALTAPARVIGVGFPFCAIPTIFPMPWDVPMDEVLLAGTAPRVRPR